MFRVGNAFLHISSFFLFIFLVLLLSMLLLLLCNGNLPHLGGAETKNKTGSMLLKMAISHRMENLASLNSSIPTDRYFHDYLSECVWVCARGYVGGCDPLLPSEETRRPLETAGNWWKQAPAGVASGDPLVLAAEKYHAITRLDSRPYFTRIASVFHPGRIC